jgi:hypothetical protein
MNTNKLIRTTHRWLGVSLIALTIINAIAFSMGYAIPWLYYLPLIPLFLSMISGLYMFALHYIGRRGTPANN